MTISARDPLRGRVPDVAKGATTAHLRIEAAGGAVIAASIANEAADELGLAAGKESHAVVEASDVMIAVDRRNETVVVRENEIRAAEAAVDALRPVDAALVFVGRLHAKWTSRLDCPRQGRPDGPSCRIEAFERIEVLYWLHLSRRDLGLQSPRSRASQGPVRRRGRRSPGPGSPRRHSHRRSPPEEAFDVARGL